MEELLKELMNDMDKSVKLTKRELILGCISCLMTGVAMGVLMGTKSSRCICSKSDKANCCVESGEKESCCQNKKDK